MSHAHKADRRLSRRSKILGVGAAVVALAIGVGGGAAAHHGLITSAEIRDGNVRSNDIKDGGVWSHDIQDGKVRDRDLTPWVRGKIRQNGVADPEVDGFYETLLDNDEVQTFTAECAGDKVATGGGFSVDFPQHRDTVRFVGSTPTDFTPIPGDPEGSVVAHGWEIQVINDGPETSVRPWVACSTVAE